MNTTSYTDMLEQLRNDRDQTEQHLSALRSSIAAFEKLTGTHKRPKRTRATTAGDTPAELASLGTKERILHVMNADPAREWTLNTLAEAAHVASLGSVRGTVGRLAVGGEVLHNSDDQTWTLATAPGSA